MRTIRGASLFVFAASTAFGQSPTAPPAFDVASVKVSQVARDGGRGSRRQSANTTPGGLNLRNFTFRSCVQWAYNLKDYQVTGPGWIDNERYDIVAKAVDPVQDDELRRMLQTLLADRFKLVFHREIRELPVYAMSVGKDGMKMKPSEGEGESNITPPRSGSFIVAAQHTSMAQFADVLSQPLQRPVVDMTGLKGGFDFTIDISRYLSMDDMGPRREGGGGGGAGGLRLPDISTIEAAAVMALREQLGLKLESKKSPIDMIVVDKAEKVPTEN